MDEIKLKYVIFNSNNINHFFGYISVNKKEKKYYMTK